MNLTKIDLKNHSNIDCTFSITEDNAILYVKVSGNYRRGSAGNEDGLYLFSIIVAHYFAYEPISLIIDMSSLKYSWGNTILKSLNFFSEIGRDKDEKNKVLIIIHSKENQQAITGILNIVLEGRRILCKNYKEALEIAINNVIEHVESY